MYSNSIFDAIMNDAIGFKNLFKKNSNKNNKFSTNDD